MMNSAAIVGDAEKRAAMEQVLQSATFLRANQVRNFLRYICEMEIAGRGASQGTVMQLQSDGEWPPTTATPGGRLASEAATATFRLSAIAVVSSGLNMAGAQCGSKPWRANVSFTICARRGAHVAS